MNADIIIDVASWVAVAVTIACFMLVVAIKGHRWGLFVVSGLIIVVSAFVLIPATAAAGYWAISLVEVVIFAFLAFVLRSAARRIQDVSVSRAQYRHEENERQAIKRGESWGRDYGQAA